MRKFLKTSLLSAFVLMTGTASAAELCSKDSPTISASPQVPPVTVTATTSECSGRSGFGTGFVESGGDRVIGGRLITGPGTAIISGVSSGGAALLSCRIRDTSSAGGNQFDFAGCANAVRVRVRIFD